MASIKRLSRQLLRTGAFNLAQTGCVSALKARALAYGGALTILNFHRVSDRDGGYAAMRPALFDELIAWLKQGFDIVLFRDLEAVAPRARPPLILSFDDGYKCFIETVVPILEKHGVCANQNVIASAVESGRPPMNVEMQDFIASAPRALLRETSLPGLPSGVDANDRFGSCLRASAALKGRPMAEQKAIFAGLERHFARFDGFRPTAMMSVEDIRQVGTAHEIGAHSFEHASMATESDDYLRQDARRCLDFFEAKLGGATSIYAYPNGSFRSGQDDILHAAGFKHVLYVGSAYSQRSEWRHPRFTMHAASQAEARFRALGGLKLPFPTAANGSNNGGGG
jgi:peptidoglycan/xylan/chitin deacetylase (PgdA/CDA1 family)